MDLSKTIKAPFSSNSRNDRNFIDQSVRLLNHMLLVSRRVKIMGVSLTVSSLLCIGCFLASHFHACQVLWHEFSHTECVGILSCTCAWNANDVTTPTTPTTTPRMGWRFATESPWTLWHPVGPGKDTHGTPVPDTEGRGWRKTSSTRRLPTNDKTDLESNVFSQTGAVRHL